MRAAAALAALALAGSFAGANVRAADLPPVEVPVIAPLTGGVGFLGQSVERGLTVIEQHVNETGGIRNRPLHFTFLDDQGQPQIAVQIINQLVAQHHALVLGSVLSANCRAMMPLVADNGPVLYCLSPALGPPKGSYVFSAGVSPTLELSATLRFFHAHGWTRFALLMSTDASGSDADNGIMQALRSPEFAGMQVVAHERYNPNELNTAAQVARIKASGAQALVVWGAPNVMATAIRSIHDGDLEIPTLVGDSIMVYSVMAELAPYLPDQLYFPSSGWAGVAALPAGPQRTTLTEALDLMRAANISPDAGSTEPWDAAQIVVDTLRKLGPDASATAIRNYIENLDGYYGIMGPYDFRTGNQRGLDVRDVLIYRWLPDQREWRPVSVGGGELPKRS